MYGTSEQGTFVSRDGAVNLNTAICPAGSQGPRHRNEPAPSRNRLCLLRPFNARRESRGWASQKTVKLRRDLAVGVEGIRGSREEYEWTIGLPNVSGRAGEKILWLSQ